MFRKLVKNIAGERPSTLESQSPSEEPKTDMNLEQFLICDHRHCDDLWATVEAAVEANEGIDRAVKAFTEDFERHLRREEEVIFPAFEDATGMHGGGPTMMMRHEHKQMRAVIAVMLQAHEAKDNQQLLAQGDTLLMLTQQHNMKEEQILYPMVLRAIGCQWPAIREKM